MEQKKKRLSVESKAIVESIICYKSRNEDSGQVSKKLKTKVIVMPEEEEEEQVEYIYQRRRPERHMGRKYRRAVIEESDLELDPSYEKVSRHSSHRLKRIERNRGNHEEKQAAPDEVQVVDEVKQE